MLRAISYCLAFMAWGLLSAYSCEHGEVNETIKPGEGALPDGIYVGKHFYSFGGDVSLDSAEVKLTVSGGQYGCELLSRGALGAGWFASTVGPFFIGRDDTGRDTAVFSSRWPTNPQGHTLSGFALISHPSPDRLQIDVLSGWCGTGGVPMDRYVLVRQRD